MSSLLQRARGYGRYVDGEGGQGQALEHSQTMSAASDPFPGYTYPRKPKDRNATDHRLQFNSKCIYERALPGDGYITCHVDRLQKGYYDSDLIHEDSIDNVRFVALHFVFHAATTINRFKKATIRVSTRKGQDLSGRLSRQRRSSHSDAGELKRQRVHPSIIRHAPHVLYGSISPETLQWNFNLAGSLGVSQMGASANISPSGGYKGSYKVYEMMRIQGSSRTYRGRPGPEDNIEDGEVVWTLEENTLQRSGLPREFTFIILLQKGDPDVETLFDMSIDPFVNSHFGTYPSFLINLPQYRPLPKPTLDLDQEIGQTFDPVTDTEKGFNFAGLSCSFEDFVALPGTTYTRTDDVGSADGAVMRTDTTKTPTANSLQNSITLGQAKLPPSGSQQQKVLYPVTESSPKPQQSPPRQTRNQQGPQQPQSNTQQQRQQAQQQQPPPPPPPPSWQYPQYPSLFPDNTLNVRVFIERAPSPSSPLSHLKDSVSARRPNSLRRSRSRTGLEKEFGSPPLHEAQPSRSRTVPPKEYGSPPTHDTPSARTRTGLEKETATALSDMQSAAQRYMAEQNEKRLSGSTAVSGGGTPMRNRRMSLGGDGNATTPMREKRFSVGTPLGVADKLREKELGVGTGPSPGASPMREKGVYVGRDRTIVRPASVVGSRMSYPSVGNGVTYLGGVS